MVFRLTNIPGLSLIRKARVKKNEMENIYTQKVISANNVFDDTFLDAKMLYVFHFNMIASTHFIGQIDGEKTFNIIKEKLAGNIKDIHETKFFNRKKKAATGN
jgi:hypothetical protein